MPALEHRLAVAGDLDAIGALMRRAIDQLQLDFLTAAEIRASHQVMGLDTQLIRDGTYFVVTEAAAIVGCGGWSYRSTLFGGDASVVAREPEVLDPATDAARIRAMYTDPDHARRGIGRTVLALCETAALAHGFARAEMMATLAGEPLYQACGYRRVAAPLEVGVDDVLVPLVRMAKPLRAAV
ncbi:MULTISPECIES: GNAT family N-acetyltransferase [unclassified Sphingomonas]|uniref:GNAT family N-acetyltransferase n=1 Tax=unclassified Sphingomonas TaxID=196159 RepID=UPI00226A4AF6|nr:MULTISPECIES: GNAT family N-acetyltransferase [unclassified Sphingomonas]